MITLQKKLNVVVTAGASGIGKMTVKTFVDQGCNVFVCDISQQHIDAFKLEFPDVFISKADVANYKEVQQFFKEVSKKVDAIDVLVNSAGIAGPTARLEDVDPTDWSQTMAINVNGMFHCLKEAIPLIKKSEQGSIVNIASSASFYGFPFRSPYTAAKWATIGMTKTLAMELGPQGIRVNAICPGSVSGERIDRVIKADAEEQNKTIEEIKSVYVKQVSMRTFVEPDDVANLILFLASPMGRFISGQAIGLDGHTEGLSTEL
jgi:NAD(P)-dependent dehydrogenase (short-subunit alcohol dehydrogenase family)